MPVAFNPPPLPQPDRAALQTADTAGNEAAGDGDAFANVLAAAESAPGKVSTKATAMLATDDDPRLRPPAIDDDGNVALDPAASLLGALQALLPAGVQGKDTPVTRDEPVKRDRREPRGDAAVPREIAVAMAVPATPPTSGTSPDPRASIVVEGKPAGGITALPLQTAAPRGLDQAARAVVTAPLSRGTGATGAANASLPPGSASTSTASPASAAAPTAFPTPASDTTAIAKPALAPATDAPPPGGNASRDVPNLAPPTIASALALMTAAVQGDAGERATTAHGPEAGKAAATTDTTPMPAPDNRAPRIVDIAPAVSSPEWRPAVVQELAQLVVLRQDRAELHVHPADLGPITVHVKVEGGQATLLVTAVQPATRDALELAIPQLRDTLAQQGITLGQASVQGDSRPPPEQRFASPADASAGPVRTIALAPDTPGIARTARGTIDVYA